MLSEQTEARPQICFFGNLIVALVSPVIHKKEKGLRVLGMVGHFEH